jgi:glycosyltransferase involved in cell wall biosynthesis
VSASPLVSVIIPAYNRVRYIDQTIMCVLEQSQAGVELIVVDDGSTDGTFERVQSYGEKLILLTHPDRANKGQAASINLGLGVARGKYIAILDSDDFWELNKLQIQVAFLEANENIGLVYTNGYYTNEHGKPMFAYHRDSHKEPNDPNAVLLDCYMALPVNSLVRKTVYDQVGGFEESFRAAQDHDMLIRIAEATQFAYLPDYLFYYRRHSDSISQKNLDVRWRVGFEILRRASGRYPYRKSVLRKRLALLNYRMAETILARGKRLEALPYLVKAGVLDPVRSFRVLLGMDKK